MFDIGFAELLIIGLVGLVVIGPDKLPDTIRTVAMWLGRAKRTYASFRQDLEREIGADEIRRELHNEAIMEELRKTREEINSTLEFDTQGETGNKQSANQSPAIGDTPPSAQENTAGQTSTGENTPDKKHD